MFRKFTTLVGIMLLSLFLVPITAYSATPTSVQSSQSSSKGKIVIANRASSSISIIDVATDQVIDTITLPGDNPAEPMYVSYSRRADQFFVGDRANNQVVAFDADTFEVEGIIPAGNGVFHMWANPNSKQLWVNNDIDNTITVIDVRTHNVIVTVPLPADLVAQGGKPHDVVISPNNKNAFVSMVGFAGPNDYVVKFSARNFKELARAEVGKDPHLSATQRNSLLYVPAQGNNHVRVLKRSDLSFVADISATAAHGAGMRRDGKIFYTTNISGGGNGGLITVDIQGKDKNTVIGTTDTPFAVPHNVVVTPNGRKVYIAHSGGTADKVSVYTASKKNPVPVLAGDVTIGLNPFGLAFVP